MSLFGSFADVLAKFSPRRPHHHRRPSFAQHSDTPPSRPHSQSPSLKTLPQIEKERNQFSLGSDKDDNLEGLRERPLVNATPELVCATNANHYYSMKTLSEPAESSHMCC